MIAAVKSLSGNALIDIVCICLAVSCILYLIDQLGGKTRVGKVFGLVVLLVGVVVLCDAMMRLTHRGFISW